MAELTDRELDAAAARGDAALASEPRARAAHYERASGDRASGRIVIELVNGCTYAFPVALVQDLQGAAEDALAAVTVDGAGFNLHWPALEVDLYVPALLAGVFGTRFWMTRELARIAGRAKTPAKAAAARANGAKGGRPRKARG